MGSYSAVIEEILIVILGIVATVALVIAGILLFVQGFYMEWPGNVFCWGSIVVTLYGAFRLFAFFVGR